MGLWFLCELYFSEVVCDGRWNRSATFLSVGRNYGDATVDSVEFCLFTVSLRGGVGNVLAYRHPNAVKAIAPLQVVRTLGMRFLFSIDEDVIWFDPAIGRKNHRAVANAAFGLHSFGEIDLPVHVGYLISVSPTVSRYVKYNKTKELAERVGFEPTLPFRVNTLSKRAPSATRPSLRRKLGRTIASGKLSRRVGLHSKRPGFVHSMVRGARAQIEGRAQIDFAPKNAKEEKNEGRKE